MKIKHRNPGAGRKPIPIRDRMQTVSAGVPLDVLNRLERLCKRHGKSRYTLAGELIIRGIERLEAEATN